MAGDERSRVLGLLESGKISAEQAAVLLDAIAARSAPPLPPSPPAPGGLPRPRPPAQLLRISVDADDASGETTRVNVNVPLKLARFAARFLPKEARGELEAQGIDLNELLAGLGDELPDGPLVDIDASDEGGTKTARIRIEVV